MIKTFLLGAASLGPYHVARFNALSNAGIDLTVVQTPVCEHYRPWDVELDNAAFRVEQPFHGSEHLPWQGLLSTTQAYLEKHRPRAVLCVGYNRRYVWAVAHGCRKLDIPAILLLVGWAKERSRVFWKEWVKSLFCRRFFTAAVVTGSRAANYARILGFQPANIWVAGNVVDNDHFSRSKSSAQSPQDTSLPQHFLTVARLSKEKNLATLLVAFGAYRDQGGPWHLRIVGTGPQETDLRRRVQNRHEEAVHWLGWKPYEDLPTIYAAASCFVLPSLIEPWGLVVNEAMSAGLPILVSRQCGCMPELCRRGVNGYDFDPMNVTDLTQMLLHMSSDHVNLESMGKASSVLIASYSLQYWAETVLDCLQRVSEPHKEPAQAGRSKASEHIL